MEEFYPMKYDQEKQKLIREKEEKMTVQQILLMQRKISQKASNEWKYEFRKQVNLLKKRIEIDIQKNNFEEMTQEQKAKVLVMNSLHMRP